jgi:hypothetical protein
VRRAGTPDGVIDGGREHSSSVKASGTRKISGGDNGIMVHNLPRAPPPVGPPPGCAGSPSRRAGRQIPQAPVLGQMQQIQVELRRFRWRVEKIRAGRRRRGRIPTTGASQAVASLPRAGYRAGPAARTPPARPPVNSLHRVNSEAVFGGNSWVAGAVGKTANAGRRHPADCARPASRGGAPSGNKCSSRLEERWAD